MTRPRGFIEYQPREKARLLIDHVNKIIQEYRDVLPLTLRQIYYVLVSREAIEKTEHDYKALTETMNKARRGGYVDWQAIRDDGFTEVVPQFYADVDDLWETFQHVADNFRVDRQQRQDRRLQVWCEAAGMVPQLERVAEPYGISVTSSGGFDSTTTKHYVGRQIAGEGSLTVLHLGDHDPSGVHLFSSLAEDVGAFTKAYGGSVEFIRLAVTPEQVEEYSLPTAPPKKTDKRSFAGLTTQCEALDPRTLAQIVEDAITNRFDMATYSEVLEMETAYREQATERLEAS